MIDLSTWQGIVFLMCFAIGTSFLTIGMLELSKHRQFLKWKKRNSGRNFDLTNHP